MIWKIAWVGIPTEIEPDIERAAERTNDLEVKMFPIDNDSLEDNFLVVLKKIASEYFDLVLFKFPVYFNRISLDGTISEVLGHDRYVAWTSEQGPTRNLAVAASKLFPHIAVNNLIDLGFYKGTFKDQTIHYLPFGSVVYNNNELVFDNNYKSDLIADGVCHYTCGDHESLKQKSVDVMILPILNLDLKVYGRIPLPCGWQGVPNLAFNKISEYPYHITTRLYSSIKLYLGISWNWNHGGYGMKLARALGTGVPVLWHYTFGMEWDFQYGNQLAWSSTPEETRELVLYYLSHDKERIEMGQRGRQYADKHLDWGKNLIKLAKEVNGVIIYD